MAEDWREAMANLLDTKGPLALKRWGELLEGDSVRTVRHTCSFCNQESKIEVPGLPPEEVRHVLRFLSEQTLAKPKDDAAPTVTGLDVSEMTDSELYLAASGVLSQSPGELAAHAAALKLTEEEKKVWERVVKKGLRAESSAMSGRHARASLRGGTSAKL